MRTLHFIYYIYNISVNNISWCN